MDKHTLKQYNSTDKISRLKVLHITTYFDDGTDCLSPRTRSMVPPPGFIIYLFKLEFIYLFSFFNNSPFPTRAPFRGDASSTTTTTTTTTPY
jgi:hypothetical protein